MESPQGHADVLPHYLTINEVAAVMQVSRRTVYRWIRMGELQVVRISGTVRIDLRDIEDKRGIYEYDG